MTSIVSESTGFSCPSKDVMDVVAAAVVVVVLVVHHSFLHFTIDYLGRIS